MSVAAGQVWWLCGPPSVGKSATAWELYAHVVCGEPRGYFDIDQVGMCYPEPVDDPGRYALKARAAGALVRRLTHAGVHLVIVSGVLDERSLRGVVDEVDGVGVAFCRLRVEPEELRRRLESRYGPEDVARALTEAKEWDQRDSTHVLVDTGEGSPLDVARRVLEAIRASAPSAAVSASRPRSPAPSFEGSGRGRAVLICGPAGVGKSTVGFGLFMNLLATGRAGAYLDLQQLGFLAGVSFDASSRHAIIADCVADLWEQYRAVGAQDLVLTGQIEQPDDVQRYRDALGATPLVVSRLQASPEGLRERITARSRGAGPRLAGDALLGLSADDAEAVLERSLAQQAHLEQVGVGDVVLDTEDADSEAVTQLLVTSINRTFATP